MCRRQLCHSLRVKMSVLRLAKRRRRPFVTSSNFKVQVASPSPEKNGLVKFAGAPPSSPSQMVSALAVSKISHGERGIGRTRVDGVNEKERRNRVSFRRLEPDVTDSPLRLAFLP